MSRRWRVSIYRDDSVTTVVYEDVKHCFWTSGNTVLSLAQYAADGSHHYINWPRESFSWFKVERSDGAPVSQPVSGAAVGPATQTPPSHGRTL